MKNIFQSNSNVVLVAALAFAHDGYLSSHMKVLAELFDVRTLKVDKDPLINKIFRRRSLLSIPFELLFAIVILIIHRPSLVVTVGPKVGFLFSIATKFFPKCRHAHWLTGQVWANHPKPWHTPSYHVDKVIVAFADILFCDGYSQLKFVRQKLNTSRNIYVPGPGSINGVASDFFEAPRNSLNSPFVICFVGRKAEDKGIAEIIRLARACSKAAKKVRFILAGPIDETFSDYQTWLTEETQGLNNIEVVDEFVSPKSIFDRSDALILLSRREGFSGIVVQAQASGLPVLCSNIYGLADTFINGKTGFGCDPDDIGAAMSAIEKLQNKVTYCKMSTAAYEFAMKFETSEFQIALRDCYSKALQNNDLSHLAQKIK